MSEAEDKNEWKIFTTKKSVQSFNWSKAFLVEKMLNIKGLARFLKGDIATKTLKQGYRFFGVRCESVVGRMKRYEDIEEPEQVLIIPIENDYGDYAVFYKI